MKNKKKYVLVIILVFALVIIFNVFYLCFKERKVVVLAYHKIVPTEIKEKYYKNNKWIDTTERFEEQMKFLFDHEYTTLSMNEYEKWRNGNKKIPLKTVMITIDDGDIETYYEIMPILKKYNFKATYFMIGEKVKIKSEKYHPEKQQFMGLDLIEKAKKEYPSIELQSHSYGMHRNNDKGPLVYSMSKNEISEDFDNMKFLDTNIYCYPYGALNDNILEVLEEKEYRMAFMLDKSGVSSRNNHKYKIPRVKINNNTSFSNFKKWLIKGIFM